MELPDDWPLTLEQEIMLTLVRDWDPLCLNNDGVSFAHAGRYEKYVAPILEILQGPRSVDALANVLLEAKLRDFGIIDFPRRRNRVVARKLLQIKIPGSES